MIGAYQVRIFSPQLIPTSFVIKKKCGSSATVGEVSNGDLWVPKAWARRER